jgi:DNA-binding MarR family transcriptional regulator
MQESYDNFFNACMRFRKLNFSGIIPEISGGEFAALQSVRCCEKHRCKEQEKVTVSMLADEMCINITAVSRTLKALEEEGYIERSVSRKDRRITYVELTEAGQKVLERTNAIISEFSNAVVNEMGIEQMEQLTTHMIRLYDVASREIEKRKIVKKGEKE